MKYTRRALVSIKRRKSNSLILLGIVFIMANVLITTLAITHSIDNTKKAVLSQFKPSVALEVDYMNIKEDTSFEDYPVVTPELVEKIANINRDFIESYDYVRFFSASSKSLEKVSFPGVDLGVGGLDSSNQAISLPIDLLGTQSEFSKQVAMSEASFLKGQGFSPEDHAQGANKAMISKEFAELNNLDIGSVISFTFDVLDYETRDEVGNPKLLSTFTEEMTITGIIDFKNIQTLKAMNPSNVDYSLWYDADKNANSVIVPNSFIGRVNQQTKDIYIEAGIDPVKAGFTSENVIPTFILKDYKDLEQFLINGKSVLDGGSFRFVTTEDQYKVIAQPLESVGSLLDLILVITIIASVVILSLVLCIFIYFRQKEIGIYLALGERKQHIIGQLLIESLSLALVAATAAIFTGMLFTSVISQSILSSMLSSTPDMGMGNMSSLGTLPINNEMITMHYNSAFSVSLIAIFYGALILTVVISQMITTLYLLRLNPKKILM